MTLYAPRPRSVADASTIVFPAGITRKQLFLTFLRIGMSGFGGVMPHARHVLVVQKSWLSEAGFMQLLSLGQLLPGPNIVNVSIMIGARIAGASGAIAAMSGLILMPFLIVLALGVTYRHFSDLAWLRGAIAGVSAAAAGLILATGVRLARASVWRWWVAPIALGTFVAVAIWHLHLVPAILLFGSLNVLCAARARRADG